MKIGNRMFADHNETYIMGILNMTPDSFSDGGKWNTMDRALRHTEEMMDAGADIIDIGGESTRPGHTIISEEEEINRIAPVIEAVKQEFDIPVSADTYKSNVAEAAMQAGADLINDIWGLRKDIGMADVIAKYQVPCCLMHNRDHTKYRNLMGEIKKDLQESLTIARQAGISEEQIILDPGVGFGKTYAQNLECLAKLETLHSLGYPVLLGTSRKSVIGNTLHLPPEERVEGTLATTVMAVMKGCSFVRVHDVEENRRVIAMTRAIMQYSEKERV